MPQQNTMLQTVAATISRFSLLDASSKPIIVGLSGGADSVALLHLLVTLGYNCIAANCNFHLRGYESNRDTEFASQFAKQLGTEFVTTDFDIEAYRTSHSSTSVEEACRELRYEWFDRLKTEHNAQAIAVGHHSDDSIETFLFNLQRGTGLRGLAGIQPRNNRGVVRPLIEVSRSQILEYCTENRLRYVTDSSNLSNDYSRNKLRNIVIPQFENHFPNIRKGIGRTIENLSESARLLAQLLEEKRAYYSDGNQGIRLSEMIDSEPNPSMFLYEWFKDDGLTRQQSIDIVKAASTSGSRFPTSRMFFSIDRGRLVFSPNNQPHRPTLADFTFEILPISEFRPATDRLTACFSTKLLNGNDLEVRSWQRGDRIRPFGMEGTKKVSDIFSDAKIAVADKPSIPLLIKGDKVLWVTGLRHSSELKVEPEDLEFIRVNYIGPQLF